MPMQHQSVIICADGTRRLVGSSRFAGANLLAARACGGRISAYPEQLKELAQAKHDGLRRADIVVLRKVQVDLAAQGLSKAEPLYDGELKRLKNERKRRREIDKNERMPPPARQRRFTRLKINGRHDDPGTR